MSLQSFASNIWLTDGPVIKAAMGFHYPTRMAVIRLDDGGLFVWSPIALTDQLKEQINDLGPVRHLVAPNTLHHVYLRDWVTAYPQARLYGPPGLAAKRTDLQFDEQLQNTSPGGWQGQVDQVIVPGNRITTEVIVFHRASQTVLVTDLMQQLPQGWFSGWRAWVARLDLMMEPEPTVPRKFRVAFTDKPAARQAVAQILQWPCTRLVVAHGAPVAKNGQAVLQRAFSWLD